MTRLLLVGVLALAAAANAQEASDGGAQQAPQLEDREAPPMNRDGAKPEPKPAEPAQPEPGREVAPVRPTAPEPKPEPKPAHPPRITVHAFDEDSAAVLATQVEAAISQELAGDERVKFISKAELLTPTSEQPRLLGEADLQSVDADDALAQGDVEKAKQLLEKALKTYQGNLPRLAERGGGLDPFRDAWLKMARARFFDGDQKGAREALRFAFVLDPSIKWDPRKFPAAMKKVIVESRLLFDTLGSGTLNIDSDPPGATVYLNGKKLGKPTPLEAVPAPPGPNYISYERRDWLPVSAIFEVAGGGESASAVRSLEHFPGRPLQPLLRAQKQLDHGAGASAYRGPPMLKDGAEKMNVDMLVLVRLEREDAGLKLIGYLYDARTDLILKRLEKLAPENDLAPPSGELAKELTSGVRLDGEVEKVVPPRRPSAGERLSARMKEFRQSKAFWPVIGGVVGAIVVGTVVGVGIGVGGQHHGLSPGEQVVLIGGR
jgi:hypothetical protein